MPSDAGELVFQLPLNNTSIMSFVFAVVIIGFLAIVFYEMVMHEVKIQQRLKEAEHWVPPPVKEDPIDAEIRKLSESTDELIKRCQKEREEEAKATKRTEDVLKLADEYIKRREAEEEAEKQRKDKGPN